MRKKKYISSTFAVFASALILMAALSGCGGSGAETKPADAALNTETASPAEPAIPAEPSEPAKPAEPDEPAAPSEPETGAGRQDGERFEEVIILEGMEETVRYEHVRSDTIGFEMDYDYESLVRHSESERECFVSIWDDPDNAENYLEVTCRSEDADTVSASVVEELSNDYDVIKESFVLDRAGDCIRIDASNAKGSGGTPDLLQTVYIIPTADGSLVAAAHCSFESAEGFGRRFAYMVNTLSPVETS